MKTYIPIYLICFFSMMPQALFAQQTTAYLPIYPEGKIPNGKETDANAKETIIERSTGRNNLTGVTIPSMRFYPAPKQTATGSAVIICPGGGYAVLAFEHEGEEVARAFNARGMAAFVLKYRLPNDLAMQDKSIGPLQDAQQAIYLIRKNASYYGIDPNKVGIMGFSAGGHLASTAATHFKEGKIPNPEGISLRPDFELLIYPVISMDTIIGHAGSRENLLGKTPGETRIKRFSNELQVDRDTPPTFLVHAEDDASVPIAHSQRFAKALEQHKVLQQLITYPKGGHGFGLHNDTTNDHWFPHALSWLEKLGF